MNVKQFVNSLIEFDKQRPGFECDNCGKWSTKDAHETSAASGHWAGDAAFCCKCAHCDGDHN